jgi:putative ABC transport system permease protein
VFNYYFGLAVRSLKRNIVLTVLMIAAIGVGIGASMTTLTMFRAMDHDPIPQKSRQLFAVQIDNWGPKSKGGVIFGDKEHLQNQISYIDAIGLMNAHAAHRQSAMYVTGAALTPSNPDLLPFQVQIRAAYAEFFQMFDTPFLMGAPWTAADDEDHAAVAVISGELNDKIFAGANSIGKTVNLDNHEYRVVGVMSHWEPIPKFYDLNNNAYGKSEEIYLPFTRAIDGQMPSWGNNNCGGQAMASGWEGRLRSECIWLQFWAELPTAADVQRYRSFINNYAADQQRTGRFTWPPHTRIRDVQGWLLHEHAVTDEIRILVLVSFSFLLVCLLNAMGLMLAKIMGRAGDIGVRRALGASRRAIFAQCLIEAGVIGFVGGLLGLALTALGLLGLRALLSEEVSRVTHFSPVDIAIAVTLAVVATTLAGLYPTWRAAQVQPAWQLKAQ